MAQFIFPGTHYKLKDKKFARLNLKKLTARSRHNEYQSQTVLSASQDQLNAIDYVPTRLKEKVEHTSLHVQKAQQEILSIH